MNKTSAWILIPKFNDTDFWECLFDEGCIVMTKKLDLDWHDFSEEILNQIENVYQKIDNINFNDTIDLHQKNPIKSCLDEVKDISKSNSTFQSKNKIEKSIDLLKKNIESLKEEDKKIEDNQSSRVIISSSTNEDSRLISTNYDSKDSSEASEISISDHLSIHDNKEVFDNIINIYKNPEEYKKLVNASIKSNRGRRK